MKRTLRHPTQQDEKKHTESTQLYRILMKTAIPVEEQVCNIKVIFIVLLTELLCR